MRPIHIPFHNLIRYFLLFLQSPNKHYGKYSNTKIEHSHSIMKGPIHTYVTVIVVAGIKCVPVARRGNYFINPNPCLTSLYWVPLSEWAEACFGNRRILIQFIMWRTLVTNILPPCGEELPLGENTLASWRILRYNYLSKYTKI